jgi:hypothetical protein
MIETQREHSPLRLTLGVDPGVTGAIAVLADGELLRVIDLPSLKRDNGSNEIDAMRLSALLRGVLQHGLGAAVHAVCEELSTRPTNSRTLDQRSGVNAGIVLGVLGALGVSVSRVHPQRWKRHFALIKQPKDASRIVAMSEFPKHGTTFRLINSHNRADATLIALWGYRAECWIEQPKPTRKPRKKPRRVAAQSPEFVFA